MILLPGFDELAARGAMIAVNGLWQATAVALLMLGCLRLFRGLTPSQRFAGWVCAFSLALTLPLISTARGGGVSAPFHAGPAWAWVLVVGWAFLSGLRGIRLIGDAVATRAVWREALPLEPSSGIAALLAAQSRRPQLCTSAMVQSPCVVGFFLPRLLLPDGLIASLTEDELRQIVLHECEHLRRYDDWLNLFQKLALTLFPLSPALLFVDRRLGLERELACDAGVVSATGAPLAYAASLARLAQYRVGVRRLTLALSAWGHRSELGRRVLILLQPARLGSPVGTQIAFGVLGAVLATAALGIANVPAVLSFRASPPMTVSADADPVPTRNVNMARMQLVSATVRVPAQRPAVVRIAAKAHRGRRMIRPEYAGEGVRESFPSGTGRHYALPAQQYLVPIRFSPSYAAVPFGDGWLIVQL